MRERSIYREKLFKMFVACERFPILGSREKSRERNSSAREDLVRRLRSSGPGCLKAPQYVTPKSATSTKRLFKKSHTLNAFLPILLVVPEEVGQQFAKDHGARY